MDDFARWLGIWSVSHRKFCRITGLSRQTLLQMTSGSKHHALTTRTAYLSYTAIVDGFRKSSIDVPKKLTLLIRAFDKNLINDFFHQLHSFDVFSETKLHQNYLADENITFDLVHSAFISAKNGCAPMISETRMKVFTAALNYAADIDEESHPWARTLADLSVSFKHDILPPS